MARKIDHKEVLKKAIAYGVIDQKEADLMKKEEAVELIFTPNLSTKKENLRNFRSRSRYGRRQKKY